MSTSSCWINSAGAQGGAGVTIQSRRTGFNTRILFRPSFAIPLSCLLLLILLLLRSRLTFTTSAWLNGGVRVNTANTNMLYIYHTKTSLLKPCPGQLRPVVCFPSLRMKNVVLTMRQTFHTTVKFFSLHTAGATFSSMTAPFRKLGTGTIRLRGDVTSQNQKTTVIQDLLYGVSQKRCIYSSSVGVCLPVGSSTLPTVSGHLH